MKELFNNLKNYTLLCVEDEDGIRKRLVNTLKYYFKEVYEASDGEDGYYKYYDYRPDIILSDIEMPNKNGIEMVKKIRENDNDTIVAMITAYSNEEYLLDLINLNINQYILKPVNSDSLINGILKAFGNKLVSKLELCESLYFDMSISELIYNNEIIILRKREKELIQLLFSNKNSVTTYNQIEEKLWKDKIMTTSALKTFIKELRKKIPKDIIKNIPQEGYKLT